MNPSDAPKTLAPLPDHPDRTRRFLDAVLSHAPDPWSDSDLAAMLLHQLSLPPQASRQAHLAQLKRIKSRMKRIVSGHTSGIPQDLARAIYFVVIAHARINHKQSISDLPLPDLRAGLTWTLARPWVKPSPDLTSRLSNLLTNL